ncbi:MAG TPA: PilZ domain-containing protein [Chloroflexota bacterium]|nr:PilZ domain-containing protein [Chloroflexota bacterium]
MIPPERVPLERGQPALLLLETDEPGCQSWIAEQTGELVWIEATAEAAGDLRLQVGDEVLVRTWRPTDALYVLRGRVEQVHHGARLRVGLRLREATRQQQRQYFRVPLDVPAEEAYCLDQASDEPLVVHVRDLSASGIGLLTPVPLWVGAQLTLRVRLPGALAPLTLRARVVRVVEPQREPPALWQSGATLIDLPPETQELLIRFAIQVQQEWRRRGRL